jgi:hypothetical protein
MAISENATPDSEAKRWFVLAIVGTLLYGGTTVTFVLMNDVEPQDPGKHIGYGRPAAAAPAHDHDHAHDKAAHEEEHHGHTH